ncbi:MAG: valine--tRNA ligase [Candidatus Levybacteria bacterium]|nr:valine--tRNA ligase [Candidatus Levybacteria bacterium]
MDKVYNHKFVEEKIYQMWETNRYFTPPKNQKKPYSIILPPPNANAPLHFGHAMYVIEDILIRFHRMKGFATLWLPGADHAGFETQFVFEKKLEKEGKSRFDFDRETLYKMILDYVLENKKGMQNQLKRLGFSLDWTRNKFTLDEDIVKIVYKTFKKMYDDGLIYRGERLVNYCTKCGTSFSDLEVNHKEQKDPLYFIKYGPLTLATVRPETKFGDTAIAVNTKDKRYQRYIGKEIEFETLLGKRKMKIIADEVIDPDFGTGVVKVTPAHDMKDFEMGKRHNLEIIKVIDLDGRLTEITGPYKGMRVKEARGKVAEDMEKKGLIEKVDNDYIHTIEVCYKCGTTIEPMLMPQWFVKMEPLANPAIEAIEERKIKFYPKRHEKNILWFLKNIKDWNISRQIVWGIRIPAWQCQECNSWVITEREIPEKCKDCNSKKLKQDEDTFDTWFSSAQWPFATLKTTKPGDFDYFYPTSVMETMYDILLFWVARMIMVGIYATGEIPFKDVVLHGMVKDPLGKKMSKSKGNVIDPLETVDQYGADAVRFALVYGTAFGNDQALSYPKLDAARKFTNKLWNIGRFIEINRSQNSKVKTQKSIKELLKIAMHKNDREWIEKTDKLIKDMTKHIEHYNFHFTAEGLYDFTWHEFADKYIEDVKNRITENSYTVLINLYLILLKLLHPFVPFVTEEIYQRFGFGESLAIEEWPVHA